MGYKLFAGRARDLEDAATVVRRQGKHLDWGYLERRVEEFAAVPGRERLSDQLAELRDQAEPGRR